MTWRAEREYTGPLVVIILSIALVFLLFHTASCSKQQAKSAADVEKCLAVADAHMQKQVAIQCHSETFAACLNHDAIVAAWEKEARACR